MVTTTFTLWVTFFTGTTPSLPPRTITAFCDVKAPDDTPVTWTQANVDARELRTCWLPPDVPLGLNDGEYGLQFSLGTVSNDRARDVRRSPFLFIRVTDGQVIRIERITTPPR